MVIISTNHDSDRVFEAGAEADEETCLLNDHHPSSYFDGETATATHNDGQLFENNDNNKGNRGSRNGRPRMHRHESAINVNRIPRLVKRNMPQWQSNQRIAIVNKTAQTCSVRYGHDFFHSILRWPTCASIYILISIWTCMVVIFAWTYMRIDEIDPSKDCGLGDDGNTTIGILPALAFSLETCTTVGYGLPSGNNAFFENCPRLQVAIYFQMVFSMLFNAFLFAFFFARLSRSETRGNQVLFSKKAIIEYRDGKWLFHCRVYDLDSSQPVVEAHVRLYTASWTAYEQQAYDDVQPHLLHTMRLLQPTDELGSSMFTSVPTTVTHHIDAFSPLTPPELRENINMLDRHGLPLREVDCMVENSGGIPCPVCGETFATFDNLQKHIQYNKLLEEAQQDPKLPIEGSHRDPSIVQPKHTAPLEMTEDEIKDNMKEKEIVCVLEGIEPLVSGTFQALQSYKMEDIVWGGKFCQCMSHEEDGDIYVDLDNFHTVIPTKTQRSQ